MIKSFADKRTLAIANNERVRSLSLELQKATQRKLTLLEEAGAVEDLRLPPSNHLEKLIGDRHGQWSLRINRQWRLCFEWHDGHVWNVELVDYH